MNAGQFKKMRLRKGYKKRRELADAMTANKTSCSVEAIRKWETGRRGISAFVEAALRALPDAKKSS